MITVGNDEWWRDLLIRLQRRQDLPRETVRDAWTLLWEAWQQIDLGMLRNRFLPAKLRTILAMRRIDPRLIMAAPTLLMGLTAKGLSRDELAGLTDSFVDHHWFEDFMALEPPYPNTVYSNGFGGDDIKTINVSTSAMIIAAAAGTPVFKVGSRSYFSLSGAQDFVEAIGVRPLSKPQETVDLIREIKIAYVDGVTTADESTQALGEAWTAMPDALQLMKALTYPFRFPLLCLNPLRPKRVQRGISMLDTEVVGETLLAMHGYIELGQIVAGMDTQGRIIDEVSNVGPSKITEIRDGEMRTFTTQPEDWGVPTSSAQDLIGGDGTTNAALTLQVLACQRHGALRDLLLVNASQFIYLAGMAGSFKEGTDRAREAIDSGKALLKLQEFVTQSGGDPARLQELQRDGGILQGTARV